MGYAIKDVSIFGCCAGVLMKQVPGIEPPVGMVGSHP
jgi:hypothetical protein